MSKKIEVPENILELSQEMNRQDNRSTAHPMYIVVGDERQYGDSSWCDESERVEETEEDHLCDDCKEIWDDGEGQCELPEHCRDCDSDAFHWYRIKEHVPYMHHGVFLTGEACDEYIKRRSYEMPANACSYGISAYWSYDMKEALKFLSSLTTEDGQPANNYR